MIRTKGSATSRRDFLKLAAGSAAFGPFFLFPDRALASQKMLKIAKWAHFLPEFDHWFVNVMAPDWGNQNDTKVTVDVIPVEEIRGRAFAEVKARKGHDLFIFPWPPAEYYQHVLDHSDVYQTVASRYGAIQQLAFRSTFNSAGKHCATNSAFPAVWRFHQRWRATSPCIPSCTPFVPGSWMEAEMYFLTKTLSPWER